MNKYFHMCFIYLILIYTLFYIFWEPLLIEFLNRSNLLQRLRLLPVTEKIEHVLFFLPSSIHVPFIGWHHQSSLLVPTKSRSAFFLSFSHGSTNPGDSLGNYYPCVSTIRPAVIILWSTCHWE